MALYLPKSNTLLLLTPKTGSTWIRNILGEAGVQFEMVGEDDMRHHDHLSQFNRDSYSRICCFVRNPIDWYRSYWAYRMEGGWRPKYRIDELCQSNDFQIFIRNVVLKLPGALKNIYDSYAGSDDDPIDFVGKQENLVDDLCHMLELAGETYNENVLRNAGKINSTSRKPVYTDELKELITYSEWNAMERFGYLDELSDSVQFSNMRTRFPEDADHLRLLALWTEKIHWKPDSAKPNGVSSETRYARILSNYALFAQHKKNDFDTAEYLFQKALALDPRHPRTLCNYGLFMLSARKNKNGALEMMLKTLRFRPNHPYTLGRLGFIQHRYFGNAELAEVFLRQSLAANPNQPEACADLAELIAEQIGRTNEVEEIYIISRQQNPDDLGLALSHACFLTTSQTEAAKAREIYQKLKIEIADIPIVAKHVATLLQKQSWNNAVQYLFEKVLKQAPDNSLLNRLKHIIPAS